MTPERCPACAVHAWLELVGENQRWTRSGVRRIIRDGACAAGPSPEHPHHRHLDPDPRPEWQDSLALMSSIDRWGYLEMHRPLHQSSISAITRGIDLMLQGEPPVMPPAEPDPGPRRPLREITAEQEAQIYARADELSARMARIFEEFGADR